MLATMPRQAVRLINYLKAYGGSESTTFVDDNGKPDLEAAREFAEKLRDTHKKYLNELITINQSYNRVTISIVP